MLRAQNRGGLFLWLLAAFGEHFEPFLGYRKRKKPCKYTLQGFAIICFDILRYGRDSNPRPPAWQAGILTSWTTTPLNEVWLAVTYSHMGKPHTTIGASAFHFWVRYGVRWDHRSIAARIIPLITFLYSAPLSLALTTKQADNLQNFLFLLWVSSRLSNTQNPWALYS